MYQAGKSRPAYILLQLVQCQAVWMKQGRCGTTGDIVAHEGEHIAQRWQDQCQQKCTDPEGIHPGKLLEKLLEGLLSQLTVRRTHNRETRVS